MTNASLSRLAVLVLAALAALLAGTVLLLAAAARILLLLAGARSAPTLLTAALTGLLVLLVFAATLLARLTLVRICHDCRTPGYATRLGEQHIGIYVPQCLRKSAMSSSVLATTISGSSSGRTRESW
jgi:hypothetical protein